MKFIDEINVINENYEYFLYVIKSKNKSKEIKNNLNKVFDIDYIFIEDESLLVILNNIEISKDIVDFINTELMYPIRVGYSKYTKGINNIKNAYLQAKKALDMVYLFGVNKIVYGYGKNKIDDFISSFSDEQIKKLNKHYDLSMLNEDDVLTINVFINCNLNIALASRELFLHRNTLIYRLDRIQRTTNLDVRKFDDALILRILLLFKYRL
ncbi:MAG: helix-turn-helix domain-containing protein [Bacillota bacterium]|nr:helix-turn-helix domain-containing protein [Bacillota bacterium]